MYFSIPFRVLKIFWKTEREEERGAGDHGGRAWDRLVARNKGSVELRMRGTGGLEEEGAGAGFQKYLGGQI